MIGGRSAFIPQAIIAHEIAKNIFRRYLRKPNARRFDAVWMEYQSECEKYYKPLPQLTEAEWKEKREALLEKLNRLLAVAEQG
jgi:hypothetical protein